MSICSAFTRGRAALKRAALCILPALLLTVSFARADDQDPKRGHLPDGRAFRTDEDGNQLVDYIAELEVNVDTLEKRVYGLEDEVKQKQAMVDRLQRGQPAGGTVEERDLTPQKMPASHEACPACPRCDREPAPVKCDDSMLRSQLQQARDLLQRERESRTQEVAQYEQALQKVEGPAKNSAQQVAALSKDLEKARADLNHERQRIDDRDEKHAEELRARDNQIAELTSKVGDLQEANNRAQLRADQAMAAAASYKQAQQQQAALAPAVPRMQPPSMGSQASGFVPPPGSLGAARERAIDELRQQIAGGLARMKTGIANRDALFAHFDQRGRALQIRPSPLKTSRGSTPESIARDLQNASSVRELVQLRDDQRQLEARINDDIATVRRMSGQK